MPAAKTRVIAFDSSTESLAIALVGPDLCLGWQGPGGPRTSAELLPRARQLLASAGAAWDDLAAVAFGAGPGAFTGLRAACAAAQGLAFGLGCPVLSVDSLMQVAEDAARTDDPGQRMLWVAMDARMDEVYAGAYLREDAAATGWRVVHEPALFTLEALNARWKKQPPVALAGNAAQAFEGRLDTHGARRVDEVSDRAAALGRLAWRLHQAGAGMDAAQAMPVYLRDKVALTEAERAAAKVAQ